MHRSRNPKMTLLWLLAALSLLGACDALPGASSAPAAEGTEEVLQVQEQQVGSTPQESVELFLEAWNVEDFERMYSLVSPRTGDAYPFEDFVAQYRSADAEMGFEGVQYSINETSLQGQSAAVRYDATIESSLFGSIEDTGRTMRLVQGGGGWQVAWAPMDIINGMSSNIRLTADRRFAPRGNIYDRSGFPVVQEGGSLIALYLNEQDMSNIDDCFDVLARVTLRPRNYFVRLFVDYAPETVAFVAELDTDIYEANRADIDNICGAGVDGEFFGSKVVPITGRNYWGHGALAHITGYTGRIPSESLGFWEGRGYRASDIVGLQGVENAMQDYLAGAPEQYLRLIEPGGIVLRELGGASGSEPTSVTLTIDRELQYDVAQAFNDAWNFSGLDWATVATGGAAVVLDVNTGAILALHSYPTYDPRIFNPESAYDNAQDEIQRATVGDPFLPVGPGLLNRAAAEQYFPGSTFKLVTAIAAADSNTWSRDRIFDCTLEWRGAQYGDTLEFREDWRVVFEFDPAGQISMPQAIATSCNPFFWEVGGIMYRQEPTLAMDYARLLGLGSSTRAYGLGIAEASGSIPNPPSATEALNYVIGQGDVQVTALQMARLVAAIANGGTVYRPYVVQQIGGRDGEPLVEEFTPEVERQLQLEPDVLPLVRDGMCLTTTDEDLGTSESVFGDAPYTSCGKTGTAQTGRIAPHSWYVTYAPADNPQIAVTVVVTDSREGSEVAAPIARRILDNYFDAPWADWPEWWATEYVPVPPPRGTSG